MNSLSISIGNKTSAQAGEKLIRLSGILDRGGSTRLLEELRPHLHSATSRLVLDISTLRHISGDGIEALAKILEIQKHAGGEFSIVNTGTHTEETQLEARELQNGVKILQLAGNLDLRGTQTVEQTVLRLCEGYRPRLLLDLSAADMIVSLGIRMLLQAIKTANAHGGRVLFLNPSATVSSALEFSGLAQFIARGKDSEVSAGMA